MAISPRWMEPGDALAAAMKRTHVAFAPELARALAALATADWLTKECKRVGDAVGVTRWRAKRASALARAKRLTIPVLSCFLDSLFVVSQTRR